MLTVSYSDAQLRDGLSQLRPDILETMP